MGFNSGFKGLRQQTLKQIVRFALTLGVESSSYIRLFIYACTIQNLIVSINFISDKDIGLDLQ